MTRKTSTVHLVGNYFASKGKVLTADEYKNAEDAPVRFQIIKRAIGSWSRLLNMIGDISQYDGTIPEEVKYGAASDDTVEETEEVEEVKPEVKPVAKPEVKPVVEKTKEA